MCVLCRFIGVFFYTAKAEGWDERRPTCTAHSSLRSAYHSNLEALGWRRTRNNLEEYHAVYYVLLQGIILEGLWRAQPN